jgi:hypothetical protein
MRTDPLSFFASEKTAAEEVPNTAGVQAQPKLDTGERALAGLAAGSSIYTLALPFVGEEVFRHFYEKETVPWGSMTSIKGVGSVGEARSRMAPKAGPLFAEADRIADDPAKLDKLLAESYPAESATKNRFLGLFDISGRPKPIKKSDVGQLAIKFDEVADTVDSFINKHNLAEKGVRMDFHGGMMNPMPRYEMGEKLVKIPRVSKEVVLHELGHAADYTGSKLGKIRSIIDPLVRRSAPTAIPIAMIAGDSIAKAIPGTVDDKVINYVQEHAPEVLGASLAATLLYPEAKASILATRHIRATEGAEAAAKAAKRYAQAWGTYALGMIPAIVGVTLARKYMRENRARNAAAEQQMSEKTAAVMGTLKAIGSDLISTAKDIGYVTKEIGEGTAALVKNPGTMRNILRGAKEVGTSPAFIYGSLVTAVPATLGALYLYGTKGGEAMRDDSPIEKRQWKYYPEHPRDEDWRGRHPLAYAGIVGAATAMSGGFIAKILHDIQGAR